MTIKLLPDPHSDGALLVLPPEIAPAWWVEGAVVVIDVETFGPERVPVAVVIRSKDMVDRVAAVTRY